MNLRDLTDDVLGSIGYDIDNLEDVVFDSEVFAGKMPTDKSALLLCSPLHRTSFKDTIMSELNNTVVLCFNYCNVNDLICKVGMYFTETIPGIVDLETRILSYYANLHDGRTVLVGSFELYQALHEK